MSSLSKLENRLHNLNRKHRETTAEIEHAVLHKAALSLTAATFGALARNDVPAEIKGVPWKLPLWLLAQTVEAVSGGPLATIAGGVADAAMAVYTANAIANKSWVAGNEAQSGNL